MTKIRHSGPQGDLNLRYDFEESDLGQQDAVGSADIAPNADGNALVLTVIDNTFSQTSATALSRVQRYEISAQALERLIVKHGRELDEKPGSSER